MPVQQSVHADSWDAQRLMELILTERFATIMKYIQSHPRAGNANR